MAFTIASTELTSSALAVGTLCAKLKRRHLGGPNRRCWRLRDSRKCNGDQKGEDVFGLQMGSPESTAFYTFLFADGFPGAPHIACPVSLTIPSSKARSTYAIVGGKSPYHKESGCGRKRSGNACYQQFSCKAFCTSRKLVVWLN